MILDEAEKARFQVRAAADGMSLGAWLRAAAREKLDRDQARASMTNLEQLNAFFESCDSRQLRPEAEWEDHRKLLEGSRDSGERLP